MTSKAQQVRAGADQSRGNTQMTAQMSPLISGADLQQQQQQQKRARIQKACDHCRLKKIKCDGQQICKNCINYKAECTYNHVPKKRSPKSAKAKALLSTGSDSNGPRSSDSGYSLDGVAEKQNTVIPAAGNHIHLGKQYTAPQQKAQTQHHSEMAAALACEGENAPSSGLEQRVVNVEVMLEKILNLVSNKTGTTETLVTEDPVQAASAQQEHKQQDAVHSQSESDDNQESSSTFIKMADGEHYFGIQSSFSVFSSRGVKWVSSKLNDPDLYGYFTHTAKAIKNCDLDDHAFYTTVIDSTDLTELPSLEVFSNVSSTVFGTPLSNMIGMTHEEVMALYSKRGDSNVRYSDSLILNVFFSLGVKVLTFWAPDIQPDDYFNDFYRNLGLTRKKLEELERSCYLNSMFYFHRLQLVSEGFPAVLAIALLICYADLIIEPQLSYRLVGFLIRLAQEIGLHRAETYAYLPKQLAERRFSIFLHCYSIDRTTSLKCSRPAILHEDDVSALDIPLLKYALSNYDESNYIANYLRMLNRPHQFKKNLLKSFTLEGYKRNVMERINRHGCSYAMNFLKFSLTEILAINSKAYSLLFSATALQDKTGNEIVEIIEGLNRDQAQWFKSIPEELIKDFSSPQTTLNLPDCIKILPEKEQNMYKFHMMYMLFQYYHSVLTVNRTMWSFSFSGIASKFGESVNKSHAAELCIDSSRKLLYALAIGGEKQSQLATVCFFFPFCAFITLFCSSLEDITRPRIREDIESMIFMLKMFQEPSSPVGDKLARALVMIKVMCYALIKHYEKYSPNDKEYFRRNPEYTAMFMDTSVDYTQFLVSPSNKRNSEGVAANSTSKKAKYGHHHHDNAARKPRKLKLHGLATTPLQQQAAQQDYRSYGSDNPATQVQFLSQSSYKDAPQPLPPSTSLSPRHYIQEANPFIISGISAEQRAKAMDQESINSSPSSATSQTTTTNSSADLGLPYINGILEDQALLDQMNWSNYFYPSSFYLPNFVTEGQEQDVQDGLYLQQ